jgi:hypothetical protein
LELKRWTRRFKLKVKRKEKKKKKKKESKEEGLYSLQEKKRDEYSYEGMTS